MNQTLKLHPNFRFQGRSYNANELRKLTTEFLQSKKEEEKEIGHFFQSWFDDMPFIHGQTSGSTGKPKPIRLMKSAMWASALSTGAFFQLPPTATALLCLPVRFIAGKMMLVRAMSLGLHLDFVMPSSTPLKGLNKSFDFSAMTPQQVQGSMGELDLISCVLIGGSPLSVSLRNRLKNRSQRIYETFGMTETLSHIAARDISSGERYFTAMPYVHFTQQKNCLVIHAPKIVPNKLITNDWVNLRSSTQFEWLGRADFIINSGGIKIHPEQIEEHYSTLTNKKCIAMGLPDERLGEKLVLVFEHPQTEDILEKFRKFNNISPYHIPKNIYYVPTFVKTANGKINRMKTRQIVLDNL